VCHSGSSCWCVCCSRIALFSCVRGLRALVARITTMLASWRSSTQPVVRCSLDVDDRGAYCPPAELQACSASEGDQQRGWRQSRPPSTRACLLQAAAPSDDEDGGLACAPTTGRSSPRGRQQQQLQDSDDDLGVDGIMTYVGSGEVAYMRETTYKYVGHGGTSSVHASAGPCGFRALCGAGLLVALLACVCLALVATSRGGSPLMAGLACRTANVGCEQLVAPQAVESSKAALRGMQSKLLEDEVASSSSTASAGEAAPESKQAWVPLVQVAARRP